MKRVAVWLGMVLLVMVVLLGSAGLLLRHYVTTEDFRLRAAQQLSAALGVPVMLGGIGIDVFPVPAVTVEDVQVKSTPPLTFAHVEVRPTWDAILQRKVEIATLLVRDAVVPQEAVAALAAASRKTQAPSPKPSGSANAQETLAMLPRRIVLEKVTWVDGKGNRSVVDAQWQVDASDGLPASIEVAVRQGRFVGTEAEVLREGDHWKLSARVGGGTIQGRLTPALGAKGERWLDGQFDSANVEVSALTAPSRTFTGRLDAHTTLRADLGEFAALADTLVTQTRFTVRNAVVHGVDLAQAVKTVGMQRSGETHLDTLAGTVATRGRAVQVNNLVATSGVLSANGAVAMAADKRLSGQVTVSLASQAAGGVLGVPLVVGGTLDSPSVTLSRGALVGAAIGTAIAPGLGTGAGAGLGDKLGKKLGGLFHK